MRGECSGKDWAAVRGKLQELAGDLFENMAVEIRVVALVVEPNAKKSVENGSG